MCRSVFERFSGHQNLNPFYFMPKLPSLLLNGSSNPLLPHLGYYATCFDLRMTLHVSCMYGLQEYLQTHSRVLPFFVCCITHVFEQLLCL
mmetsp:Transcript_36128/g.64635  ORF Transcript_36128/g.64635 Transcript_36128/m.64635 type:complete len:90 (-) Transcript_36128:636-905(-)